MYGIVSLVYLIVSRGWNCGSVLCASQTRLPVVPAVTLGFDVFPFNLGEASSVAMTPSSCSDCPRFPGNQSAECLRTHVGSGRKRLSGTGEASDRQTSRSVNLSAQGESVDTPGLSRHWAPTAAAASLRSGGLHRRTLNKPARLRAGETLLPNQTLGHAWSARRGPHAWSPSVSSGCGGHTVSGTGRHQLAGRRRLRGGGRTTRTQKRGRPVSGVTAHCSTCSEGLR